MSKLGRLRDFITTPVYRRVLFSRLLLKVVSLLNKNIKYIGCEFGKEQTFLFINDSAITPYTLAEGGFQRADFFFVIDLLKKKNLLRPNGVFFDVGANIGTQTVYAMNSGMFSEAHAFEPEIANVRLLRANIAANGFYEHVSVNQCAVSDVPGKLAIKRSKSNCGDHRVRKIDSATDNTMFDTVSAVTLDQYVASKALNTEKITFVWMDAQGHEGQILRGASSLLAAKVPMVLEIWPHGLREAGGFDSLMRDLRQSYLYFYDLRGDRADTARPIADLESYIVGRYKGPIVHTDILVHA